MTHMMHTNTHTHIYIYVHTHTHARAGKLPCARKCSRRASLAAHRLWILHSNGVHQHPHSPQRAPLAQLRRLGWHVANGNALDVHVPLQRRHLAATAVRRARVGGERCLGLRAACSMGEQPHLWRLYRTWPAGRPWILASYRRSLLACGPESESWSPHAQQDNNALPAMYQCEKGGWLKEANARRMRHFVLVPVVSLWPCMSV